MGKPGVLQFMGSQRVGHECALELTEWRNRHRTDLWTQGEGRRA